MGVSGIPIRSRLMMARALATTDNTGLAVVELKAPADRKIEGGMGWFENPTTCDYMLADIIDKDNVLGYGAGAVVGKFYDDGVGADNEGWYIPSGGLKIEPIADLSEVTSGLYLRIRAYRNESTAGEKFICNVKWGG